MSTTNPPSAGQIGLAAGLGGLGGLLSFLGGRGDSSQLNDLLGQATTRGTALTAKADTLGASGADALGPVLQYFRQLAGGDPSALMAATAPDRTRVVDQYDTARRSISNFSPRGGGTNASLATSRFNEGTDLATLTSNMRTNAANKLGDVGTSLEGLSLSADQLASMDLNSVIQAILAQKAQKAQAMGGFGQALGSIAGHIVGL